MTAPAPKLLLTVEEAAERLGVGRSTMYGLILDGAVESIHIGRLRRVPADALSEYLTRLRATQAPARLMSA
jgi:excisionase family DNA binding protein